MSTAPLLSAAPPRCRIADEYAREKLFEPLGFSKIDRWRGTDGRAFTYCCSDTTSRDFARLDLVVVRNGTYVKAPGDPIADPTLFSVYPPGDLIPGKGTVPPYDWDHQAFLGGIIDAIDGG